MDMMEDIQALQGCSLSDLRELPFEEKQEVMKQIEEMYKEGSRIQQKAQELSLDTPARDDIVQHAKNFVDQAHIMKMKMTLVDGKPCENPDDIEQIIQKSISVYAEEQSVIQRLQRNCKLYGLEYRGVTPSNGNCFFESISCQLERLHLNVLDADQLRKNVVNFIKENSTYQGNQGFVRFEDFMEKSLEEYCATMSENGVYADHVIVIGMARMLKRDIVVVTSSPSTESEDCIIWINGGDDCTGEPFLLGHVYENHYQSLQHKGEASKVDLMEQNAYCNLGSYETPDEDNGNIMTNYIDDKPFEDYVQSFYLKGSSFRTEILVKRVRNDADEDDIITQHLIDLDTSGKGSFNHRNKNLTTVQYRCERCRKPRGKKKGGLETRANNCNAYVSFQFMAHLSKKAVIIRQKLNHNGHSLNCKEEKHHSRPDPRLLMYIDTLLDQEAERFEVEEVPVF